MKLVLTIELVKEAEVKGYAVPSFCVWNAETIKTVIDAAPELKAPVILMNGWVEFLLLNPESISAIAHSLIKTHLLPTALDLDHGDSIDQIKANLAARYTAVMLDYSTRPFDENVKALKR